MPLLVLAACDASQVSEPSDSAASAMPELADMVLLGGTIYTVDPQQSWAEALAVKQGRIIFVGDNAAASGLIGERTKVIELDGRMVLPGIQDTHIHPIGAGIQAQTCDLNNVNEVDEYIEIVRTCADRHPDEAWVSGGGWYLSAFGPGGLASKSLLDEIVPDRPVYLPSADGHTAWVNSRALEIAGITAATPDPEDGIIDRDPASGEPLGSLQEGAMNLVERHLPPVTLEKRLSGLRYAINLLNAYGITAMQDASVRVPDLEAYAALDAAGELTMRVVAAQWWERDGTLADVEAKKELRAKFSRGRVNAGSVKIMQDGVIENYTAAMLEPYLVAGNPTGIEMIEPDFLSEVVTSLDAAGFQVHFHAIGDAAVRQCLDAVQHARNSNPGSVSRHHISHLEVIDPADIPRFAELDVVANFQPLWAYPDDYITELTLPFIGPERGQWLYPIASVLQSGGTVAFGSDWSVSTANPYPQIEVAVRRSNPATPDGDVLTPEQQISLGDAIAAFTIHAAFVNGLEADTGSIEVGKFADLVVLDRNLFEIDAADISETQAVMTMLEGEIVHDLMSGRER